MEKSKFLMVVIVILLLLNLGTLTFLFMSQRHPPLGPPPHHQGGPAGFITEELKFNDEQKQKFEELKKEHQSQMRGIMDSIRIQRELLPDLIVNGDNKGADSISTIIGHYQKKTELYTYAHFVKVKELCNDEQKKKFKSIISDILKMMAPPKGEGHHPPH